MGEGPGIVGVVTLGLVLLDAQRNWPEEPIKNKLISSILPWLPHQSMPLFSAMLEYYP